MAIYLKVKDIWKSCGDSWTPTLSFNSNGGTGTMESYTGFGKFTVPELGFSRSGYRFLGWNTKPDGSGTTYTSGQVVDLSSDITLYAQWIQQFKVSWWKVYNCDWPTTYPPASNTGPVHNSGNDHYYLRVEINGSVVSGLTDVFDQNNNTTSKTYSMTVDKGAKVRIILRNKKSGYTGSEDNCLLHLNGTAIGSASSVVDYTYTVQNNIEMAFQWNTSGVAIYNGQSYWVGWIQEY
ncbi:MAG: InlB B-repeat-containing protein [Bacteroidaceae bacterium]|nr:InlB B-repeat-containing protein [Bacteroidaceae bacterium]